ncbi:hypothetical protein Pstr01_08830 [Pseudomonas straminea]|uniref:Lipoprotein n=1 Tax=Pseudomonas straminea TaxID=47882 RepID=A0A1I1T0I9_PSEOC|nr:hypothetical protein [Pseudomonas straminea]GLX12644.1 hypothetical protein Pstr01_08830 [Pseudomonas straminea]SFD50578.1 hypothetical protein SAMN05216372_102120 [Pseudomonas straminea]
MKLRSPVTSFALLGALFVGLAGCSNIKPSEDKLKTLAETNLGETVSSVGNVRSDSMQTYYVARTGSGDYNCTVASGASGATFTVASFGLMQPTAYCQRKGSGSGVPAPFAQ